MTHIVSALPPREFSNHAICVRLQMKGQWPAHLIIFQTRRRRKKIVLPSFLKAHGTVTMAMLVPFLRAGAQSGTIMSLSDLGTQLVVEGKKLEEEYSLERTLRWGLAGMVLQGPYNLIGFSILDKHFGTATTFRTVAVKTMAAQLCLFPPYIVALFGLMGTLEGQDNILAKIQARVPETFVNGCCYWPIINGVNFTFVPPSMRVPYIAVSAAFWNSYLSWANAREDCIPLVKDQSLAQ